MSYVRVGTSEAQDVDDVSWEKTCEYHQGRAKAGPSEKTYTVGNREAWARERGLGKMREAGWGPRRQKKKVLAGASAQPCGC